MRNIAEENTKVVTGLSPAVSSHKALNFNLVSPFVIIRLAQRLSVGAAKYGSVQWRQGINDVEYVTDRFNHTFQHLLNFMIEGNTKDDNLGAILWGLQCLLEVERLAPEALEGIVGVGNLFGEAATIFHKEELNRRG